MQSVIEQYHPPHLRENNKDKKITSLTKKSRTIKTKRLKVKGSIKNKYITILIDSRSTHNLTDINVAKELNLFVYPVKSLTVSTIIDGHVGVVGQCHKVSLQIQDLKLQTRCYTLPLKDVDMVLGAEWLSQLGTYATNLNE